MSHSATERPDGRSLRGLSSEARHHRSVLPEPLRSGEDERAWSIDEDMAKIVLITGASSGIGAATAELLAGRGCNVCLVARRADRLRRIVERIEASRPGAAAACPGDVTKTEDRDAAFEAVLDRWGRLDVLVNNAGYALPGAVEDVDLDEVRGQFEVNVFAYVAWMQAAGRIMRRQRAGRIINVGSVSGLVALPGVGIYAATKYAVEALSDAARREYRRWNVPVVLVEPGSVTTEIWAKGKGLAEERQDRIDDSAWANLYEALRRRSEKLAGGAGPGPDVVARAILRAATSGRPKARYRVLAETHVGAFLRHLPASWQDAVIRHLLKAE